MSWAATSDIMQQVTDGHFRCHRWSLIAYQGIHVINEDHTQRLPDMANTTKQTEIHVFLRQHSWYQCGHLGDHIGCTKQ